MSATQSACTCGNNGAQWHGPKNGRREFMCDDCWDDKTGAEIARVLLLKRDREHKDRWQTTHGTKTNRGIARTVAGILEGIYS